MDVASNPSIYNNLTNPRATNLISNLKDVNNEVGNYLGVSTPQQAGLGQQYETNLISTVNDLPSLMSVAEDPSQLNNFTVPRQINVDNNPTSTELSEWHPDYSFYFLNQSNNKYSTYGVPAVLRLGYAGDVEQWTYEGGYVTTTREIRDLGYFKLNNKYGPKELVAYNAQNTANPPGTEQPLSETIISDNTGLISYSTTVKGDFRDQLLNRTLGVGIIPFSTIGSGINYKPDGTNISDLDKIARKRRGEELKQRLKLNFIGDTVGAINLDPLSLLSGGKLINKDYTITVPKSKIGKVAQFTANLAGFNLPKSTIPEGSFGWDTPTPSTFGSGDIDIYSDLLDSTGSGQKSILYDSISYNLYGPKSEDEKLVTKDYLSYPSTTTSAPTETRKKTLIDKINDKVSQVLNNNKKSPTKPEQKADTWFPHEGGYGKHEYQPEYTATSDDLGINAGLEDLNISNTSITDDSLNWMQRDKNPFKRGLLKYTQEIINNSEIGDAGGYIGYFDSQKNFKDNNYTTGHKTGQSDPGKRPLRPSKGNQVRNVTINKSETGDNFKIDGGDVYCRSWTSVRQYDSSNKLIRKGGNWWRNADKIMVNEDSSSMLTLNYDKNNSGMPKIAWDSNDSERFNKLNIDRSPSADLQKIKGLAIPYMFSIENLAWKDAPQIRNLPPCEIGPNGGRIMWFPPYDINFSDSTSINWDTTNFIGRGEPIYTYNHTERSGQLSWTIVVDHPAVLNQLKRDFVKNVKDDLAKDNFYHSFFAGCNIDDVKNLFKDFIPKKQEIVKKDETTFTPVVATPPAKPPVNELIFYLENCITNGTRYGIDYSSPKGVGRDPAKDIGLGEYEVTKACIGGNYAGTLICTGRTGLNVAKLPPTDIVSTPVSVLDDLQQLANFLITPDGKNYQINVEASTSKSNPQNDFNKLLAKDRANNTIELLFNLMTFVEDGSEPASITSSDGKKYYYPKETELKTKEYRWKKVEKPQTPSKTTSRATDENPCKPNIKNTDANSKESKESRYCKISLEYNPTLQTQLLEQVNGDLNKVFKENQLAKNQELEKLAEEISANWINECDYFQKMEEDQPFIYKSFSEKIKYFHPAFHAITPEGFNSRLTFLQQCTRQGPQVLKDDLPQNMVFGRPPICVLRIGDFYHTKIVIDSMNFSFEPLQWDLNPEGIGVQPMLAKIDMGFKFIGGSSLGGPISQLQNAVSFNFFANTSVYNPVESLDKLMNERKKMKSKLGIYGSFITPKQANDYYNKLESPIEDTTEETNPDVGQPSVDNTVVAPIDDSTLTKIEEGTPVSETKATEGSTQPPTVSKSNGEGKVTLTLVAQDTSEYYDYSDNKTDNKYTYYINILKPSGKYLVYSLVDTRTDCCPGTDKKDPSLDVKFKFTKSLQEAINSDLPPGDILVKSNFSKFSDNQITCDVDVLIFDSTIQKYKAVDNPVYNDVFGISMEVTYNPGKNKTTGFQQEVVLNEKIYILK